ncbi:unnamed protein product [Haemonchus placei]|uniref:Ion_trans domain-containing protein n=1 Tax=Haemonchus placei TaxID=6290 RepID=A0A158QLF1_HAEPC|nr:unnamed protein product [Haemonchus placei]
MMAWGFNATAEQTRRSLKIQDWPWVDKVQVFFVVIAVLMSLFSLFFLLVGFSATGATREEMYKRKEAKCGGRFACVVAMLFCLICWLFIISIVSIFCGSYFIFDDLCLDMSTFTEENCINFEVFAPLVRSFSSDLRLCGGDAQQFCAFSATARSWYIVGWVGSCFVIIGLSSFLAVLAANYAHVGNVGRYVKKGIKANLDFVIFIPFLEKFHSSRQRQYDGSTSTSRLAEKMSNSVSQYAYLLLIISKLLPCCITNEEITKSANQRIPEF